MTADQIIAALPAEARVLVQGGAGESVAFAEAAARAERRDLSFVGVLLPGVNRHTYGAERGARITTFFLTPELKAAGAGVAFMPVSYTDIGAYLRSASLDACVAMVTPPDSAGLCSFGPAVDFLAELWPQIPVRIGHINPALPRTRGPTNIPRDALTYVFEADAPVWTAPSEKADAVADAIAAHFARLVPDAATVQAGIGKLPGAGMRALCDKRGLRIHSGLVGDWAIDLSKAGALADAPIVAGLALGTERLYAAIAEPRFEFRPASHTHSPLIMSALNRFVTLNSAFEVDLLGQAYAEAGAEGLASGPGGALEFSRGAKLAGGLRVIAIPATAAEGAISRIVGAAAGRGPVSLSRFDIDVVITEFGAADLRCASHDERAEALIAIAAPAHRQALTGTWRAYREQVLRT